MIESIVLMRLVNPKHRARQQSLAQWLLGMSVNALALVLIQARLKTRFLVRQHRLHRLTLQLTYPMFRRVIFCLNKKPSDFKAAGFYLLLITKSAFCGVVAGPL